MTDPVAVVFGGSGFVGSHLADELTRRGYDVRVCDHVPSPYLSESQTMRAVDLAEQDQVLAACEGADVVFNYAGLADIDIARDRTRETVLDNILGNLHVLEAVRELNINRLVFASSVYVYSESGSFYRISKQAAEAYTEEYGSRYGLPYTILRFGSLYGRRAGSGNTIASLLGQAFKDRRLVYGGTGDELREYIHVLDAARAAADVAESEEYVGRRLVLTGHQAMRVREVLQMIREILPFDVEMEFLDADRSKHYSVTPYKYSPKVGEKLGLVNTKGRFVVYWGYENHRVPISSDRGLLSASARQCEHLQSRSA